MYDEDDYKAEKAQYIHEAQMAVWSLWINRLLEAGWPVEKAEAQATEIVKEWTGHRCMVGFQMAPEDAMDIPF